MSTHGPLEGTHRRSAGETRVETSPFPPGVTVFARGATTSTNEDARELAARGAPHLSLVWAETQASGRGRSRRAWQSPAGNLYWSLLLRPASHWPDISQLAHVSALAVHAALRPHLPAARSLTLKWPNDALIDGRKVSGILIEASGVRTGVSGRLTAHWVVVGIGINVLHHPVDGALYPATSLAAEGSTVDRDRVLVDLTEAFVAWLERWAAEGFGALRPAYLARAHGLGDRAVVRLSNESDDVVSGIHEGVDEGGRLLLRGEGGAVRSISAGDVFFDATPSSARAGGDRHG